MPGNVSPLIQAWEDEFRASGTPTDRRCLLGKVLSLVLNAELFFDACEDPRLTPAALLNEMTQHACQGASHGLTEPFSNPSFRQLLQLGSWQDPRVVGQLLLGLSLLDNADVRAMAGLVHLTTGSRSVREALSAPLVGWIAEPGFMASVAPSRGLFLGVGGILQMAAETHAQTWSLSHPSITVLHIGLRWSRATMDSDSHQSFDALVKNQVCQWAGRWSGLRDSPAMIRWCWCKGRFAASRSEVPAFSLLSSDSDLDSVEGVLADFGFAVRRDKDACIVGADVNTAHGRQGPIWMVSVYRHKEGTWIAEPLEPQLLSAGGLGSHLDLHPTADDAACQAMQLLVQAASSGAACLPDSLSSGRFLD